MQVGKLAARHGGDPLRGLAVGDGDDQGIGALGVRRAQHVRARGVAIEHRQPAGAAGADPAGAEVEDDDGDLQPGQVTGEAHAHLAEAGDHHVAAQLAAFLRQVTEDTRLAGAASLRPGADDGGADDGEHHAEADGDVQQGRERRVEEAVAGGKGEDDEGELAALAEQAAQRQRLQRAAAEGEGEAGHDGGLDDHDDGSQQQDRARPRDGESQVQGHADGHEEQAEEEPPERRDVDRHLMAVLGVGDHHAGEEGAERHGQPGRLGREADTEDEQQRRTGEHLRRAGAGGETEERAQQCPGEHGKADDDRQRFERGLAEGGPERFRAPPGDRDVHQNRADQHVLDEQHGEGRPPEARDHGRPLAEQRQDDRGRRVGERQADQHSHGQRKAESCRDRGEHRRGDDHHGDPQGEHPGAEQPQALDLDLQADREQQEGDTEGAEMHGDADVIDEAQHRRADHSAAHQVAEHRADAQPLEQRHEDQKCRQQDQDVGRVFRLGHGGR